MKTVHKVVYFKWSNNTNTFASVVTTFTIIVTECMFPDPHRLIWREQFSTGDQSKESRVSFFNSGFAACVKCGQGDVWRFEETAGVRENGDMYGTAIFRCQNKQCKWKTSFMFDDGGKLLFHISYNQWDIVIFL